MSVWVGDPLGSAHIAVLRQRVPPVGFGFDEFASIVIGGGSSREVLRLLGSSGVRSGFRFLVSSWFGLAGVARAPLIGV